MASLCIIPARGGSKRIPRKNIKDFCGKPVIVYSIEAALKSNLFDEVMVSTDDQEIAEVAKVYGAEVPFFRSKSNSTDFASTVDVLLEVLQEYGSRGLKFESACCIYATAPLIKVDRLKEGWKQLIEKRWDTVFPIVRFSYPIGRALQMKDNKVTMIWPENLTKRTQDLPPAYHDAGQWYWFSCERLVKEKKLWTDNTFGVEIDELEVQDIDTMMDWKLAELKYELLQHS